MNMYSVVDEDGTTEVGVPARNELEAALYVVGNWMQDGAHGTFELDVYEADSTKRCRAVVDVSVVGDFDHKGPAYETRNGDEEWLR